MKRIGVVGIALIGLWVLVTSPGLLVFVSFGLASLFQGGRQAGLAFALLFGSLPFMLALVVGLVLIAKRTQLADRLFDDSPLELAVDSSTLIGAGVVLLGLAIAVGGGKGLLQDVSQGVNLALSASSFPGGPREFAFLQPLLNLIPGAIAQVAALVLGLVFVIRSRSVTDWIVRRQQPRDA